MPSREGMGIVFVDKWMVSFKKNELTIDERLGSYFCKGIFPSINFPRIFSLECNFSSSNFPSLF